jgi:hypothetical protein
MGFPSSWTVLYRFIAATASAFLAKTTSAVPWVLSHAKLKYKFLIPKRTGKITCLID